LGEKIVEKRNELNTKYTLEKKAKRLKHLKIPIRFGEQWANQINGIIFFSV